MREKNKAPINKIHELELEALEAIATSVKSIIEDEEVTKINMKQLSDTLQELLRVYVRLNEFYTRLLMSNEDLD